MIGADHQRIVGIGIDGRPIERWWPVLLLLLLLLNRDLVACYVVAIELLVCGVIGPDWMLLLLLVIVAYCHWIVVLFDPVISWRWWWMQLTR